MRDALTDSEMRTLVLVARGLSNAEVAAEQWVGEQTVKFHMSNAYRKLGVSTRTAAVWRAMEHGLLDPPAPVERPIVQCPFCERRFDWPAA